MYGVGKAAVDRMAADIAYELLPHGIAALSLWPVALGAAAAPRLSGLGSVCRSCTLGRAVLP